jgi:hypothetical protein
MHMQALVGTHARAGHMHVQAQLVTWHGTAWPCSVLFCSSVLPTAHAPMTSLQKRIEYLTKGITR